MRNEFTANTDAWLGYGNWLIDEYDDVSPLGTVTLGVDVVSTNWLFADDRVETTLEAVYDDETESYTDLEWRLEEPEEPDYKVEIRNKAAEHAADELQTFRTRFIAEDEDEAHELPEPDYVEELKGRYLPSLRFGEESKHVLEILIGELDSKQSA
ncbi:hypothetical protein CHINAEXTREME_20530 (plasmid) [Halobiforma lacisalsi AJ5]|uniref:Uncharacterized protein n=2 Tax=Natronobacterium lacisalsi TaxID=229731 RepID=M0LW50_NATLA|nr:hypothetical protein CHINAEXTREME_20530 [Halobiforma lacisalsi AJ5]EMA37383.1 hypothetical protein C445_00801 [Halobiforma lacisalsi AJ5]